MQVSLSVDTRKLEDALHNLARAARVEPGKVMKQEAKMIVEELMDKTFPATLASGRRAVSGDIGKVFASLPGIKKRVKQMAFPNKKSYMAALTRASKSNDENALRQLLTQSVTQTAPARVRSHYRGDTLVREHTRRASLQVPMVPGMDGSTIIGGRLNPNLHRVRQNDHGRVQRDYLSQVVMDSAPLNAYRKQVLSRVGWHKAGWEALAKQVGARVKAWVKNSRLAAVSGTAQTNFVGPNPKISATNYDVKIPGYQGIVNWVVNSRVRATTIKINRVLAGRATNLGFTRIAKR